MISCLHSCKRKTGFTLIEALVALVIFGIITVVLSAALTGSIEAQQHMQQRLEQTSQVRAIFDFLTHDIQSTVGSLNNPSSVFLTGASLNPSSSSSSSTGGSTGPISNASSLLTLSTRTQVMTDPQLAASGMNSNPAAQTSIPHSATNYVRYDLDSSTGSLTRSTMNVPNLTQLAQASPGQESTLAQHVDSLQFQFWDPTNQSWTNQWDYEQTTVSQNIANAAASSSASSSSTASASTAALPGNMTLPTAVQVIVVLRNRSGGTDTYTTTIPVVAGLAPAQPQNTAPAATTAGKTG